MLQIGDIVWHIGLYQTLLESEVYYIGDTWFCCTGYLIGKDYNFTDIGTKVFLSKEEAEQALNIEIRRCVGDCQERIGIPNGCRIVIDKSIKPQIGDMVLCSDKYGGGLQTHLKLLIGFENGKGIVSTQYIDKEKDFTFVTPQIFGVLVKCLALESDDVVWTPKRKISFLEIFTAAC